MHIYSELQIQGHVFRYMYTHTHTHGHTLSRGRPMKYARGGRREKNEIQTVVFIPKTYNFV